MKKILVPCDFSELSEEAFRFALELSRKTHGEVSVLHVINYYAIMDPIGVPEYSPLIQPDLGDQMEEIALERFNAFKNKWGHKEDLIEFIPEYGGTISSIQEFAETSKCDLVVMGARKVDGLEEYFFGSHSGKMVGHSSVPVLFIKHYFDPNSVRDIIFPNSLEIPQDDLVFRIKDLQEFFNAEIRVLYVNTPYAFRSDLETQEALKKFATYYSLRNYSLHIFSDHDEETGIANFKKQYPHAIIALSTHGRVGLNAFLNGSITKNLVNHFDYPIWTVLKK